ncbi:MAG: radical SAM protein [Desulfomonilia bacterium]|nr:radical SAM protein [Desulfomonilia bacterium]
MALCELCPRQCRVDRTVRAGGCGMDAHLNVASIVIHRGEEPPLVTGAGSGAVFFCGCPLACSFCQNKQISHYGVGRQVSPLELACSLVELQESGCSNINLVSPTHVTPEILEALDEARNRGLTLPVILNSSGYERPEILSRWKDRARIYLMDVKYGDNQTGRVLSRVDDYWDRVREAIAFLWETVGPLRVNAQGSAISGLIVRHLVLPGMRSNPFAVLEFLSEISADIALSIMSQYTPDFYTGDLPEMKRCISPEEYRVVLDRADELGFETIFLQDMGAPSFYTPDFTARKPFGDCVRLL